MADRVEPFVPELHDAGKLIDKGRKIILAYDKQDQVGPWQSAGHTFEDVAWASHGLEPPQTASWLGIRDHHLEALKNEKLPFNQVLEAFQQQDSRQGVLPPPDELERFRRRVLISLADKAASSQSRMVSHYIGELTGERGTGSRTKLWQRDFEKDTKQEWSPVRDEAAWRTFAAMLANPQTSAEQYFKDYRSYLLRRAEDQSLGRNLTSLLTHSRLVGQLYRILERTVSIDHDEQGAIQLRYGGHTARNQYEALHQWPFRLVRADVRVLQAPVRAKDLFVFAQLDQKLAALRQAPSLKDHLLFATGQTLWLLLCAENVANAPALEEVLGQHLEVFSVETQIMTASLNQITPDLEGLRARLAAGREEAKTLLKQAQTARDQEDESYWESVQQQLNNALSDLKGITPTFAAFYPPGIAEPAGHQLQPPLCEICQLRHAPEQYQQVTPYGGVEYLCQSCHDIRYNKEGQRLRTMSHWEDQGISGRLAWVRLSLDFRGLSASIERKFRLYLDELPVTQAKQRQRRGAAKANFRPTAIAADFIDDYVALLADLEQWIRQTYRTPQGPDWEEISREAAAEGQQRGMSFFVLRMRTGQELFDFIRQYHQRLLGHFPDMLDPCPVRLAVNLAPAKYPFYEHWRDLNRTSAEVWLHHPGTVVNPLRVRYLPTFLALDFSQRENRPAASYLHNLAALERRSGGSRLLAQITFMDDWRRGRKEFPRTLLTFAGLMEKEAKDLNVSHLLNWYKLTTWG